MNDQIITVEDRQIDGPHGPIPVRIYRPSATSAPGLVWLHGGAWMFGDLDMPEADWVSRQFAARGIAVVSVFYRLAIDGVHYPVPGDDVLAAFQWTLENATELGIDAARLAIGGASAGANLAAGATLRMRDGALPQPFAMLLAYPALHATLPEPDAELAAKLTQLPPEIQNLNSRLGDLAANYAGAAEVLAEPYAFPGLGELGDLPPVFVVNAEADILRPSGEAFAAGISAVGGEVTVATEPGTMHGYLNQPENPAASLTIDRAVRWLGGL